MVKKPKHPATFSHFHTSSSLLLVCVCVVFGCAENSLSCFVIIFILFFVGFFGLVFDCGFFFLI